MEEIGEKVVIPTPALAEFLVRADEAGAEYLRIMESRRVIRDAPFGKRAAVELAAMDREALDQGDKRGGSDSPYQKVKVDRQIVAIARVECEQEIYSNDSSLKRFAESKGLKVIHVAELDLPPEDPQKELNFRHPDESND